MACERPKRSCRTPSRWWCLVVRTSETQTADRMVPACWLPFCVWTVAVSPSLAGNGTQREEGAGPSGAAWTESKFKLLSFSPPFFYFSTLCDKLKRFQHANLTTLLLLLCPPPCLPASRIIKRETCKSNIPVSELVLQRAGKKMNLIF